MIRLCFFEGRTIEDAAEELNISAKTAQIAKKKAIEELTDLFALTSNINWWDIFNQAGTAAGLWPVAVPI